MQIRASDGGAAAAAGGAVAGVRFREGADVIPERRVRARERVSSDDQGRDVHATAAAAAPQPGGDGAWPTEPDGIRQRVADVFAAEANADGLLPGRAPAWRTVGDIYTDDGEADDGSDDDGDDG